MPDSPPGARPRRLLLPRARDLTGCVLDGRYELHAVIGEGAYGRVYRGRDRRLERSVAVKVIKPWWAEDPEWAESFEREAQLLARMSAPGIVQIHDVGSAPEGLFYVAELVEGESLASLLRHGPLAAGDACEIARQLCDALAQAHAQRLVHRDIKPANVLISRQGQVKLADFGVARLADGSSDGSAGTVVGTPRYMAPEQASGRRSTPATDIYSVGVVLYEMLSGSPPFSGASFAEVALRHVHERPRPLPRGTPTELVEIVERALAKEPGERYRTGADMASALARVEHVRATRPLGIVPGAGGSRPQGLERTTRAGGARPEGVERTRRAALGPRRNIDPAARRRSIALLGAALALLLVMIGGAILLARPAHVEVPRLVGMRRSAVVANARRLGLRPQFDDRYAEASAGTAIGQRPRSGARVPRGSVVRVVLSEGPRPVEVPRVSGMGDGAALAVLRSLGLGVRVTYVPAPGQPPGTVVGQDPGGGRFVAAHSTIALSLAETPRWRPVISLTGSSDMRSVPFRIRGLQWRVVYRMSYVGTCSLIFFCDGPTAHIAVPGRGSTTDFDLSDGDGQTQVFHTGPGVYQLSVSAGSDSARWSLVVEDYL